MRVIRYKKIREFCHKHADATSAFNHWYRIVKHQTFQSFADVRNLFPSADQVGNFVVFNVGGNKYRLIAFIRYPLKRVFIRHILTHEEYNRDKWKEDIWFKSTHN